MYTTNGIKENISASVSGHFSSLLTNLFPWDCSKLVFKIFKKNEYEVTTSDETRVSMLIPQGEFNIELEYPDFHFEGSDLHCLYAR